MDVGRFTPSQIDRTANRALWRRQIDNPFGRQAQRVQPAQQVRQVQHGVNGSDTIDGNGPAYRCLRSARLRSMAMASWTSVIFLNGLQDGAREFSVEYSASQYLEKKLFKTSFRLKF
jgi:hypothetical protein